MDICSKIEILYKYIIIYIYNMLFCPNCQNLLNVSKTILVKENMIDTNTPQSVSQTTTQTTEIKSSIKSTNNNVTNNINAYHVCSTCYYYEPIKEESLIISKNKENSNKQIVDYDLFRDVKYSHILPRTRAYICKNDKCSSHNNSDKEAIFFKINTEQPETYYMCLKCDFIWKL